MSTTVEIPGGYAVFREPKEMKQRQRRMIETAAMTAAHVIAKLPDSVDPASTRIADIPALTRDDAEALADLQDATIIALLESWTLPVPLPTLDTLGDLDVATYDALAAASANAGAVGNTRVDFQPSPDQSSPTLPSSGSDGRLRDEQSTSTPTWPNGGVNTATESSTT